MEKNLLDWYREYNSMKKKITTKEFRNKALELSESPNFRTSKGWFQKFRQRYKIQLNK